MVITWTQGLNIVWHNGNNWAPLFIPVITDDVIVNAHTQLSLNLDQEAKSVNFTGYTGNFDIDGNKLTVGSGNLTFSAGMSFTAGDHDAPEIICGGNFINLGCDLNGGLLIMPFTVTGTAEAHNCIITNCDFSGGTALDATDNCIDGGGNINVDFGIHTWDGSTSTDWNTASNWTPSGVPDSTISAAINGSAPGNVVLSGVGTCGSLNMSGFSNTFDFAGQYIDVQTDVILSSTMSTASNPFFFYHGDGTLRSNGILIDVISIDAGANIAFLDAATFRDLNAGNSGQTVNFGSYSHTIISNGSTGELNIEASNTVLYSPGVSLTFSIASGEIGRIDEFNSTLPPVIVNGADNSSSFVLAGSLGLFTFESFTFNNGSFSITNNLTTLGNLTFSGGVLNGDSDNHIFTCGNNFITTGVDLDGNAGFFNFTVTGTAQAHNCTITNCDFSGGSQLMAINCTDGGGNTNVQFINQSVWNGSTDSHWNTAANWTPSGVPTNTASVIVSGSQTINMNGGPFDAKSVNMSAYSGILLDSQFNEPGWNIYGDLTLSSSMTVSAQGIYADFYADSQVRTHGKTFSYFYLDYGDAPANVTLLDDLRVDGQFSNQQFGLFTIGSNKIILTNSVGQLYNAFGTADRATWSWSGGATLTFIGSGGPSPQNRINLQSDSSDVNTSNLPPIFIKEATANQDVNIEASQSNTGIQCDAIVFENKGTVDLISGSFPANIQTNRHLAFNNPVQINCEGSRFDIGGNFVDVQASLFGGSGAIFNVVGQATAKEGSIGGCDFSGGSTLYAGRDCVDNGDNTNVIFGTTLNWDGSESTSIQDENNWTPAQVPTRVDFINVSVASDLDRINGVALSCEGLDFTSFTGQLLNTGGGTYGFAEINTYGGDVTLSDGFTFPPNTGTDRKLEISLFASGTTINFNNCDLGEFGGVINTPGCEGGFVTIGTDANLLGYFETDGVDYFTVNLQNKILQIDLASDGNGFFFGEHTDFTWTTGGKLIANASMGITDFEFYFPKPEAGIMPPIEMNGPGQVTLYDQGVAGTIRMTSLVVTNGTLNGENLIANMNVIGTNTASNATIKNCDFSGGSTMIATNNCIDGGGNINVTFNTGNTAKIKTRGFFNEY